MEIKAGILSIVAVIGLVIVSCLLTLQERGTQQELLSVSGTAELTVMPDQAEIYLNIVTLAPTANQAQSDNKAIAAKVMDALKAAGVKDSDIETSYYYLAKKQEWNPKDQTYFDKGFELTHTIKVTTTAVDKAGDLVDTAIAAGANGVDRVSFGLTKETEKKVRSDALAKATLAAKEKAASIAQNSGVKLGGIVSIQENNFYYMPFEANVRSVGGAGDVATGAGISPQKVDVSSSIQMGYEIE